jgi:hypothetical protein
MVFLPDRGIRFARSLKSLFMTVYKNAARKFDNERPQRNLIAQTGFNAGRACGLPHAVEFAASTGFATSEWNK